MWLAGPTCSDQARIVVGGPACSDRSKDHNGRGILGVATCSDQAKIVVGAIVTMCQCSPAYSSRLSGSHVL